MACYIFGGLFELGPQRPQPGKCAGAGGAAAVEWCCGCCCGREWCESISTATKTNIAWAVTQTLPGEGGESRRRKDET